MENLPIEYDDTLGRRKTSLTGDLFTKKMTGPRRSHATVPSAISKYFFKFLFGIILFPVFSAEDVNVLERGKRFSLSWKERCQVAAENSAKFIKRHD
jgi:hypothetical protein